MTLGLKFKPNEIVNLSFVLLPPCRYRTIYNSVSWNKVGNYETDCTLGANTLEDHRVLDVFFAPRVTLSLGPAVNPR